MAYVIAALVLLTLLAVGNLALTLALVRRLRAGVPAVPTASEPVGVGERIGEFSITTTAGVQLGRDGLFTGTGLVAFLSPSCPPCQEQLPRVLARAAELGDPAGVLAVVVDDMEDPADVAAEVAAFDGVARVVVARTGDRLTGAFRVDAYPAVFLVGPGGRVVAAGHDVDLLPRPTRVP
jgi:thiol-disulfide isomerase/thioredoxin